MASPLNTGKQSVNLVGGAKRVPGSRIRRDPPPIHKITDDADPREVEIRNAAIGIIAFALAIVIITFAVSRVTGWEPGKQEIHLKM